MNPVRERQALRESAVRYDGLTDSMIWSSFYLVVDDDVFAVQPFGCALRFCDTLADVIAFVESYGYPDDDEGFTLTGSGYDFDDEESGFQITLGALRTIVGA